MAVPSETQNCLRLLRCRRAPQQPHTLQRHQVRLKATAEKTDGDDCTALTLTCAAGDRPVTLGRGWQRAPTSGHSADTLRYWTGHWPGGQWGSSATPKGTLGIQCEKCRRVCQRGTNPPPGRGRGVKSKTNQTDLDFSSARTFTLSEPWQS